MAEPGPGTAAEPGADHGARTPPAYPIASVDNALRLLRLFRDQPRVRLSEASEHLGVAVSTAHRLLAMLAYHGFVRQDPDSRAYLAGPALVEIGLAAVRQLDIRAQARPVLEDLAAALGETVHLTVLEGGDVRYLDAVESSRALRVTARTGSVLAANCTASGKALLAGLPDAEVTARFAGEPPLPALTGRSITRRVAAAGRAAGGARARVRGQPGGERGGRRVGRGARARTAGAAGRRAGGVGAGVADDRRDRDRDRGPSARGGGPAGGLLRAT